MNNCSHFSDSVKLVNIICGIIRVGFFKYMKYMTQRSLSVKPPKQHRSKKSVERIISAAKMLVIKDGITAVSTRNLSKASEMSVGSIYQYFPNKHAVILCLYTEWLGEFTDLFENAFNSIDCYEDIDSWYESLIDNVFLLMKDESPEETKFGSEMITANSIYPELLNVDQKHRDQAINYFMLALEFFGIQHSCGQRQFFEYLYELILSFDVINERISGNEIVDLHKSVVLTALKEHVR